MQFPQRQSSRSTIPSLKKREQTEDDESPNQPSPKKASISRGTPCMFCGQTNSEWRNIADVIKHHCVHSPSCNEKLVYCPSCTRPFSNKPNLEKHIRMTRQCRIVKIREESERHSTSNIPFQMANPSHFNVNSTEMDTHVPSGQSSSIPANNTATESYFPSVGTNTAKSTATESYFPSVGTNTANPLYVGVELLGALSNSQCILGNCTDNDIRNRGDVANQFDACNPNNTDHHNSGEDGEDSEDELSLNVPYKTNYCDSEEDDDDASINDVASNISNISNGNSWSDQNINVHSVERLEENANDDDSNPSNDPDACLEYPL